MTGFGCGPRIITLCRLVFVVLLIFLSNFAKSAGSKILFYTFSKYSS